MLRLIYYYYNSTLIVRSRQYLRAAVGAMSKEACRE